VKYAFEFLVARRYLKAKRKETVISLITAISVIGVAAGVMALIISLSINSGFRNTLQRNLLGATAHVTILEKSRDTGIEDWRQMTAALSRIPQVTSVEPTLYGQVFLSGPLQSDGAVIKGVRTDSAAQRADVVMHLKEGSFEDLDVDQGGMPGIILGSRLARRTGMMLHAVVTVTSPQGELTPFGPRPSYHKMRVVGIFESGFFDLDSSWAFASLPSVQRILSLADVVNAVELKIDDIYRAPEIAQAAEKTAGERYAATTWMEQNRQILGALRMERVVTIITIGLIELIAALNILITLTMLVMEKYRDISILMSMGARREQIRRIFMLQGVIIGVIGTIIGLIAGYTLSFLADHYRWLGLDEEVYALAFVPFEPRWIDGLWVAAAAIGISFIATLYPARNATRIAPAEALRYE
jgi:lipoprotein-releasing system permease protein